MVAATTVASALWIYWRGLYLCLVRHGAYAELRTLTDSKRARLQIYMLALHFRLWHEKHYRSGTYARQGSNPGLAGRVPGRPCSAAHACAPRLGQLPEGPAEEPVQRRGAHDRPPTLALT